MYKLIKEIRKRASMSQEEFAKELATTPLSINRWENNKTIPNNMAQMQLFDFCKKHNIDLLDCIIKEVQIDSSDDSLILYHGSKRGIEGEIVPLSRDTCDFGRGFYLGTDPIQPLTLICDEIKPTIYTVKLNLSGLKVLKVDLGIEWAMLIAFYREYMRDEKGSNVYKKYEKMADGYDVIVGYIANDRMYRVMKSFFDKELTDVALFHSLSSLDLGIQYACKSKKACDNIEIIGKRELSTLELCLLKEESARRRAEGINLTDEVLLKYRRSGEYFDEILRSEKYE